MRDQLYKEFKKENPQTIGETDSAFDNDNFIDWLVKKIRSVSETKELNIGGIKSIHFMTYEKEMTLCRECMNPMVPVKQKECINESCSKFKNNAPVPVSEVGQMYRKTDLTMKIANSLESETTYFVMGVDRYKQEWKGWYKGENLKGSNHIGNCEILLPVPNTKIVNGNASDVLREMRDKKLFDDKFNTHTLEFIYAFTMGFNCSPNLVDTKTVEGEAPLKALSEITDEHYIEVAKILGFEDNLLWHGKTSLPRITNELDPLGKPIEYSGYAHLKVIKAFQYLSQFYAVPVFYPVPEVKEKGDKE